MAILKKTGVAVIVLGILLSISSCRFYMSDEEALYQLHPVLPPERIIKFLDDENPRHRVRAAYVLGRYETHNMPEGTWEMIIDALLAKTDDPDPGVRSSVIDSLAWQNMPIENAVQVFADGLADESEDVRWLTASAISIYIQAGNDVPTLAPDLTACINLDDLIRSKPYIYALTDIGPPASTEAFPVVRSAFEKQKREGPSAPDPVEWLFLLAALSPDDAIQYIKDFIRDADSPMLRGKVILLLGQAKPYPAIVEWVISLLRSDDPIDRSCAVQYLGDKARDCKSYLPLLIEALNDPDEYVQTSAVHALRKFSDEPVVVEALISLLSSTELLSVKSLTVSILGDEFASRATNALPILKEMREQYANSKTSEGKHFLSEIDRAIANIERFQN